MQAQENIANAQCQTAIASDACYANKCIWGATMSLDSSASAFYWSTHQYDAHISLSHRSLLIENAVFPSLFPSGLCMVHPLVLVAHALSVVAEAFHLEMTNCIMLHTMFDSMPCQTKILQSSRTQLDIF
mmetsp:Transcript_19572/g.54389  ORF Transcript_19572/g.54389 Transcript_19572/m.54389 type:complete len:129 (-) Transcript_19572:737-1123(-)